MHNRITFLILMVSLTALSHHTSGQSIKDQYTTKDVTSVNLTGHLGSRIEDNIHNHVAAEDIEKLIEPFRHRNECRLWQTEFWGKWFTSAALAYRYTQNPALKQKLDEAVEGLLATQTPDGYIGNYADSCRLQGWDVWGSKYTLLGLLAWYDITQDKKTLKAAKQLADNVLSKIGPEKANIVTLGLYRGMPASSILEPIMLLYNRTGEQRYLDFAEYIVAQWETPEGPQLISKALKGVPVAERFPEPEDWWTWENGGKAYEMMSCYEGLLELYRVTGKEKYKEAVEKAWENIRKEEITLVGSGASVECWFGGREKQTLPVKHIQETCVTVTWIKLNEQLLRLTGEPKYADEIEQTSYNALLASLHPDGHTWVKYCPLVGIRQRGENQCGMHLNCCIANGPRGLLRLPFLSVMTSQEGPVVNLYNQGDYKLKTPAGKDVLIEQKTEYPKTGTIAVVLHPEKEESFTLSLRIPAWSKQTQITVNGEKFDNFQPGTYARINRQWKEGDKVELTLDMRGRVMKRGGLHQYTAIMRGPIVLSRDASLGSEDEDEVMMAMANEEGYIELTPIEPATENIWMAFEAPFVAGAYLEGAHGYVQPIKFVDYASAGSSWDKKTRYRMWIPQLYNYKKGL